MTELSIIPSSIREAIPSRSLTPVEREKVEWHLASSRSEATQRAYSLQWRAFLRWCLAEGFSPFPASPEVVCLWLAKLNAEQKRFSTISQAVAAISAVHQDNGARASLFSDTQVKAMLRSIRRGMLSDGRSSIRKPRPFSQRELEAMLGAVGKDTAAGVQTRAVLLLGLSSGMRASEIGNLRPADVKVEEGGVDVLIRFSKTDQEGRGERIYIGGLAPHQTHLDLRPALREWLKWREGYPLPDDAPLFLCFRKGGNTLYLNNGVPAPLSAPSISRILQASARGAEIDTGEERVSSHTLRHSFITAAFERRLDAAQIAKTTRHKSLNTLLGYDQSSRREASIAPALWS